ncbi:hypothetical protein MTO96_028068 [Rhipicephalus appendiculatus]
MGARCEGRPVATALPAENGTNPLRHRNRTRNTTTYVRHSAPTASLQRMRTGVGWRELRNERRRAAHAASAPYRRRRRQVEPEGALIFVRQSLC